MDTRQIGQVVNSWIAEEDMPTRAGLKPVRKYDLYTDMDEDEIVAYWDFIRWYTQQEHLLILSIPEQEQEDFFGVEIDEFGNNVSQMNTHDYAKAHPFDRYHWMFKKACERAKYLAIAYSCTSDFKARKWHKQRFLDLAESVKPENKGLLFSIWFEYAYWR